MQAMSRGIMKLQPFLCWNLKSHSGGKMMQIATLKILVPAKPPKEIEFPEGRKRLKILEKTPQPLSGQRMPKMPRKIIDMRGPELVHNKLTFKQFGIRAIMGGQLRHGHIEMMRLTINRNLDESRMFARWRIDAPWKPMTKKGQGHRMGGGKGSIDHYVTPVKAGRIILEVSGDCEYEELFPLLKNVAQKLPFKASPVCQELLDLEEQQEEHVKQNNVNIFNFQYCLKNNFNGSRIWASPYDYIWHGKHR